MKHLFFVFIGGGLGSLCRFILSKWIESLHSTPIPFGTLSVNILGSLLIGIFLGLYSNHSAWNQQATWLLVTGFCGGFTTFSAFAYEKITLLKQGDFLWFSAYLIGSITLGMCAVLLGIWISKQFVAT